MHTRVLEHLCGLHEHFRIRVGFFEVEFRFGRGLGAERRLEEFDVRVLVSRDDLQERSGLRAEGQVGRGRAVVEGRLQVLQRERVVEDADVALAKRSRRTPAAAGSERAGRQCRQDRTAAHRGACRKTRLLQEAHARVTGHLVRRFSDRAVDVHVDEIDLITHLLLLLGCQIAPAGGRAPGKPLTSFTPRGRKRIRATGANGLQLAGQPTSGDPRSAIARIGRSARHLQGAGLGDPPTRRAISERARDRRRG